MTDESAAPIDQQAMTAIAQGEFAQQLVEPVDGDVGNGDAGENAFIITVIQSGIE